MSDTSVLRCIAAALLAAICVSHARIVIAKEPAEHEVCLRYDAKYPLFSREHPDFHAPGGAPTLGPDPELATELETRFAFMYRAYIKERKDRTKEALGIVITDVADKKAWSDPRIKTGEVVGSFALGVVKGEIEGSIKAQEELGKAGKVGATTGRGGVGSGVGIALDGVKAIIELDKAWKQHWADEKVQDFRSWARVLQDQVEKIPDYGSTGTIPKGFMPIAFQERANPVTEGLSHRQAEWICEFLGKFPGGSTAIVRRRHIEFLLLQRWMNETKDVLGALTITPSTDVFFGLFKDEPQIYQASPFASNRLKGFHRKQLKAAPSGQVSISFSGPIGDQLGEEFKVVAGSGCNMGGCPVPDPCNPRSRSLTLGEHILGMRMEGRLGLDEVATRGTDTKVDPYCRGDRPNPSGRIETTRLSDDGYPHLPTPIKWRKVSGNSSVFELGIPVVFEIHTAQRSWVERIVFLPARYPHSTLTWFPIHYPGLNATIAETVLENAERFLINDINLASRS